MNIVDFVYEFGPRCTAVDTADSWEACMKMWAIELVDVGHSIEFVNEVIACGAQMAANERIYEAARKPLPTVAQQEALIDEFLDVWMGCQP